MDSPLGDDAVAKISCPRGVHSTFFSILIVGTVSLLDSLKSETTPCFFCFVGVASLTE